MKQYRITVAILSYVFTITLTINTGSFFIFKRLSKLINPKYITVEGVQ